MGFYADGVPLPVVKADGEFYSGADVNALRSALLDLRTVLTATNAANSADITIGTANGLSLVGQALSLGAAGAAAAGAVTTGAQTWAGAKSLTSPLTITSNDSDGIVRSVVTSAYGDNFRAQGTPYAELSLRAVGGGTGGWMGYGGGAAAALVTNKVYFQSANLPFVWVKGANSFGGGVGGQSLLMELDTSGNLDAVGDVSGANLSGTNTGDEPIEVQQDGVAVETNLSTLNITGSGVTVSDIGGVTTLDFTGGSGSGVDTLDTAGGTASAEGATITGTTLQLHLANGTHPGLLTSAHYTILGNTSGTNSGNVTLTAVGASPNANGASLSGQALTLELASGSFPGLLSAAHYTVLTNTSGTNSGNVTLGTSGSVANAEGASLSGQVLTLQAASASFAGLLTAAHYSILTNTSGTNSGNVTLTAVGASPNANGASLSAQALTLQPASGSFPGLLSSAHYTVLTNTSGTNSGDAPLAILDESVSKTANASSLDFVGSAVAVTNVGGACTVTITGASGVTTMAAIGASANANGATISGSNLNLEPASASFGGVLTAGTQSIAGAKTFVDATLAHTRNGTGATAFQITNTNTGTSGVAGIDIFNSANAVSLQIYSTGFTPSGVTLANMAHLRSSSGVTGGFLIAAGGTNPLKLATNDIIRLTFASGGTSTFTQGTTWSGGTGPQVTIAGSTLNTNGTENWLKLSGTLTTSTTNHMFASVIDVTSSSGSTGRGQNALAVRLLAGYTGGWGTNAIVVENALAGTANSPSDQNANIGILTEAYGTTAGANIGAYGYASGGALSIATMGLAVVAKSSSTNVGVLGQARNSSGTEVGGYFTLMAVSNNPVYTSAALIADNGSTTSPCLLIRDNGSNVFAINDAGTWTLPTTDNSASPGATTISKNTGKAAVASGASSVVVTNTLVTAASDVFITPMDLDTTLTVWKAVAGSGSFTVTGNATATAAWRFQFWVVN